MGGTGLPAPILQWGLCGQDAAHCPQRHGKGASLQFHAGASGLPNEAISSAQARLISYALKPFHAKHISHRTLRPHALQSERNDHN